MAQYYAPAGVKIFLSFIFFFCFFFFSQVQQMSFEAIEYNNNISDNRRRRRHEVNSIENSDSNTTTIICSSCSESGHSRRTNKRCGFYRAPEENTEVSFCGIARRPEVISQTIRQASGRMNIPCPFCNALMWKDKKSNSSNSNPEFQLCCGRRKHIVEQFPPVLSIISNLLKGNDAISKEFKLNIRAYNSSLSFTSLGVQLGRSVQNRINGAYAFRINGNLYHHVRFIIGAYTWKIAMLRTDLCLRCFQRT